MLWENLIIISVTVSLIMAMKYLDTMPGYSCPKYCEVNHNHYPLDLESSPYQQVDKNVKSNKIRDLAHINKY
jgi:hypothetical protein